MLRELFRKFSHAVAEAAGKPMAFGLAALSVVIWAAMGPIFRFSEDWQLVINTGTTIITFLMVFLIQSAQNRDSKAMHLKLNELIKGIKGCRNEMINLEDATDEELQLLQEEFKVFHKHIQEHLEKRKSAD